jgi:hypothetical protein
MLTNFIPFLNYRNHTGFILFSLFLKTIQTIGFLFLCLSYFFILRIALNSDFQKKKIPQDPQALWD